MTTLNVDDLRVIAEMLRDAIRSDGATATPPGERDQSTQKQKQQPISKEIVKRVHDFDGDKKKYAVWALKFLMNVNSVEEKLADVMKFSEKMVGEIDDEKM